MLKKTSVRFVAVAVSLLLAPTWSHAAEDCSLTFSIPEGWLDLSPSAPAENFQRAPEDLMQMARSGLFAAFAIRQSRYGDFDMLTVNIQPALPLTEDLIEALGNRVIEQLGEADDPMKVLQSAMVEIEGIPVGRLPLGSAPVFGKRVLVYYVPGVNCTGILMYHTNGTNFRDIGESLDASAMRTRGLSPPPDGGFLLGLLVSPEKRWKFGLLFAGAVGAVATGISLYRKTRRASVRPPLGPRPHARAGMRR